MRLTFPTAEFILSVGAVDLTVTALVAGYTGMGRPTQELLTPAIYTQI